MSEEVKCQVCRATSGIKLRKLTYSYYGQRETDPDRISYICDHCDMLGLGHNDVMCPISNEGRIPGILARIIREEIKKIVSHNNMEEGNVNENTTTITTKP